MKRTCLAVAISTVVSCVSAQTLIHDAFSIAHADLSEFAAGEALQLHPTLRAQLAGLDHIVLPGVPVGNQKSFDLNLRRANPFAPHADLRLNEHEALLPSTADLFTGTVEGIPGSVAVIGFSNHFTYGMIQHSGGTWIISSGPVGSDGPIVVFDVAQAPEDLVTWNDACSVLEIPGNEGGYALSPTENDGPPCRVADMAIETDRELLSDLFGDNQAAATDYVALLVAANSFIFERDTNTKLRIIFLRLWSSNDPWNESDTASQLFQFQDAYNANPPVAGFHGAHFFSGRGLGGGVAYLGALCYPQYNYALSANLNGFFPYPLVNGSNQNWDVFVTAHEWGHNFNAPHSHEQGPLAPIDTCGTDFFASRPCVQSQLPGTIMSYCHLCGSGTGTIRLDFHPQNINSWMLPFLSGTPFCNLTGDPLCNPTVCLGDIADAFGLTADEGGGPDGVVDFGDFAALLGLIGPCPGGAPGCLGDIADDFGLTADEGGGPDGVVDFGDFAALLGLIGPCSS